VSTTLSPTQMFMPKTQSERTGYTSKLNGLDEQDKTNLNTAAIYK